MGAGLVTRDLGLSPNFHSRDGFSTYPSGNFVTRKLLFPNPVTSWRSGPSFDKYLSDGKSVVSLSRPAGEVFAELHGDTGHEFSMRKVTDFVCHTDSWLVPGALPYFAQTHGDLPLMTGSNTGDGQSTAFNIWQDLAYSFVSSDAELKSRGTAYIKLTTPLERQADLLISIAELVREGLPSAMGKAMLAATVNPKKRGNIINALGGEYLNYIFGYAPIVSDIVKLFDFVLRVNSLVDRWIALNGNETRRRRYAHPTEAPKFYSKTFRNVGGTLQIQTVRPGPGTNRAEIYAAGGSQGSAKTDIVQSVQVQINREFRFSAAFEFDITKLSIPGIKGKTSQEIASDPYLRAAIGAEILGVGADSLGLTTAWNLTPFSWLIDWFVNIGTVFDNVRSFQSNGLTLKWGYMTEDVNRTALMQSEVLYNGIRAYTSSGLIKQKSVRRVRATPYGFGTTFNTLSAGQVSTLAALAASFTPKRLP
jgi:hypothetical protein